MLSHYRLARAMYAYYDRHVIPLNTLFFQVERTGAYINPQDTPVSLGLREMDVIRVFCDTDGV